MRKKAQPGRGEGRKLFGYYEGETAIVERMKELRGERLGFDKIAARLNAEGLRTRTAGKHWYEFTVKRILSSLR